MTDKIEKTNQGPVWNKPWVDMPEEMLAALRQSGKEVSFANNQIIYHKGDKGTELYHIQSGLIRLSSLNVNGDEIVFGLYSANAWFGEMSLLDQHPRATNARAIGDTVLTVVSAQCFYEVMDSNPIWYRDIANAQSNTMRILINTIECIDLPPAGKVARRLLDFTSSHGKQTSEGTIIDLYLSQQEFSRTIGISRQTANKELRNFEDKGWIKIERGKITLLNPKAIRQFILQLGGDDFGSPLV